MRSLIFITFLSFLFSFQSFAAELIDAGPVNSAYYQLRFMSVTLSAAENTSSYTITSSDDTDYSTGLNPLNVGRKSKRWRGNKHHWIYLELPHDLKPGKTYTIAYPDLNAGDPVSFTFSEKDLLSESIHVNHIGFNPDARLKFAYVYHWMGTLDAADMSDYEDNDFYLVNTGSGDTVYNGKLTFRKEKETDNAQDSKGNNMPLGLYGSEIWECDFSDFNMEGTFKLVVEGIGSSPEFRVDRNVYNDLLRLTSRGLYHYRSGPERTKEHTEWIKPADHIPGVTNGGTYSVTYSTRLYSEGKNAFDDLPAEATDWNMPNNRQDWMNDDWAIGGYFDAGDYDKNLKHFRISRNLLQVFELAPHSFKDDVFNIPESGNGIPDLLDEARWVIDFYRNLAGPTGGVCGGLETTGHNGSPSWDEERYDQWYAYGEEAEPTYLLAGSEAHLAYCLQLINETGEVDTLTQAAKDHYNWAVNHDSDHKERAYAAAALYKLTGEQKFLNDYKAHTNVNSPNSGESQKWAAYMYVTTNRPDMDFELKETQKQAILNWANNTGYKNVKENATRVIRNNGKIWLGESSTPVMINVIMAHYITRDPEMLDYLYTTCDYYNGGNPLNLTWITGAEDIGSERAVRQLLATDTKAIKEMVPGLTGSIPGTIVYGVSINTAWTSTNASQQNTLYPSSTFGEPVKWPAHEVYFDWGGCVETNEFTVHQTMGPATATYAYMSLWENTGEVAVNEIKFEKDSVELAQSLSASVNVSISPFNASVQSLVWSSLDPAIATVDENGEITAVSEGETMIFAETQSGGVKDTIHVKVGPFFEVTDIQIREVDSLVSKDSLFLEPNTHLAFEVFFYPENASDKSVTWTVLNENILDIDEFGAARSGKTGITALIATAHNNIADTVVILVRSNNIIPGKIEMERYSESLDVSDSKNIRTGDTEFDGTDYLGWLGTGDWANYDIIVEEEGYYAVTASVAGTSSSGTYEITVGDRKVSHSPQSTGWWVSWEEQKLEDLLFLTPEDTVMTFTVITPGYNINYLEFTRAPDPVFLKSVAFESDSLKLDIDQSETLSVIFNPDSADDKSGTWSSADPAVAEVSQDGEVTGISEGITTLRFTSNEDATIYAEMVVEVSIPLGLKNNVVDEIRIYPVPFTGKVLHFTGDIRKGTRFYIYSSSGTMVFEKKLNSINRTIEIPHELRAGVYFVKAVYEDGVWEWRIVVGEGGA